MPTIELPSLHAGQVTVYRNRKRFNVVQCGRRWGKTLFGEVVACEGAIEGNSVGWFAPTYKYLEEVWRDLNRDLRNVIKTSSFQQKRIELRTGGTIECWTMDSPDPGRSRKYHTVILDECGITKDLLEIWRSSIRATLTDYKGDAWLLGTPKGRREFHTLFAKGEQGDEGWASFRMPTSSNPAIDPDEIAAAKRELPPHIFAQEFEGIPADDGGNPFGMAAIAECFGLGRTIQDRKVVCFGIDLARAQDYTVVTGLNAGGQVVYFDRWNGIPWHETMSRITRATESAKVPAYADSTGVGDAICEELQRRGNGYIEGFHFSSKSKQGLMEGLAAGIQTKAIAFAEEVIRSELECFEYEYTKTGVSYSAPSGLHDDCVCSLALAWAKYIKIEHAPTPFIYTYDESKKIEDDEREPVRAKTHEEMINDESIWTTVGGSNDY